MDKDAKALLSGCSLSNLALNSSPCPNQNLDLVWTGIAVPSGSHLECFCRGVQAEMSQQPGCDNVKLFMIGLEVGLQKQQLR